MDLFGSFALLLAFLCGLYAFGAGIAAIATRKPLLIKTARNAGMAVCVLIWLGFGSLAYLFFTDNFSMAYVVEHSNRTLPAFFKFAAICPHSRCSSAEDVPSSRISPATRIRRR